MPLALRPTSFIPVKVTGNWTTAATAGADIVVALASYPMTLPMTTAKIFTIVEGEGDPDDTGSLQISAMGVWSWGTNMTSFPQDGQTVFIIDMY